MLRGETWHPNPSQLVQGMGRAMGRVLAKPFLPAGFVFCKAEDLINCHPTNTANIGVLSNCHAYVKEQRKFASGRFADLRTRILVVKALKNGQTMPTYES